VLLFDEIEKAHPDVWNILLQLLDDGRLTDSKGRTVNFTNTIVILTTNLASDKIHGMVEAKGKNKQTKIEAEVANMMEKEEILAELKRHFRPEFINRIDDVLVFEPLTKEQIRAVVDIQIHALVERLEKKNIALKVTDKAKDWLAENGYEPAYGARPLKRLIQNEVIDPLAMTMLENKEEKQLFTVDVKGGGVVVGR
jgi:ATP-dependent Clp protease ATP-binding subunit ClpA